MIANNFTSTVQLTMTDIKRERFLQSLQEYHLKTGEKRESKLHTRVEIEEKIDEIESLMHKTGDLIIKFISLTFRRP